MRPCSTSCINATEVTGLVIEAMRKIASSMTAPGRDISHAERAPIKHALAVGEQPDHARHVLRLDRPAQACVEGCAAR